MLALMSNSTALLTDRYELTMIDAGLQDGTAERPSVFELFARRLPGGRRFGVVAGTGRLLSDIRDFRFGDEELKFLTDNKVVSKQTLDYLANYRFRGSIRGYREGELYFPGSPVLVVEGTFADAVILETIALSTLNYDSAIATAAARMSIAAGDRPLAEMGSRRAHERAAVSASRAAYIAGFDSTSNLEAGRDWGVPTMGTAAHSWTLLHDNERDAFAAQLAALGTGTTLLVDTYDIEQGIKNAIEIAGTELGGIRIDSGDLPVVVADARRQLDELGATKTRITVTSDLDEYAIASLAASPVDAYGVGTSVVTGSGSPTSSMVYKLVAKQQADGTWQGVAKKSADKASNGGRKTAYRVLNNGKATSEQVVVHTGTDLAQPESVAGRALHVDYITNGEIDSSFEGAAGVTRSREHHLKVREELPVRGLALSKSDPILDTVFVEA